MERREIFKREILMKAFWTEKETILVEGKISDSYHEMTANIEFSFPGLEIVNIECSFIRYPHEECLDALKNIEGVKGLRVGKRFYYELMERIGGPKGCIHLNNLIYEMGMSAVQGRFARWDEMAPPELLNMPKPKWVKMTLQMMPGLRDGCSAWASTSKMVKEADEEEI